MKPIMNFYATVVSYLQAEFDDENVVAEIIALAGKANPSWEITRESLALLELCVNRGSTVEEEDLEQITRNDFAKAAFRDLSVLKDNEAMDIFDQVAKTCVPTYAVGEDMFVWARTVKERPDGSAVIVLHTSNLERLRRLLENHDFVDSTTNCLSLEEGIQIGS
jgi:hypothetical protein